jgi:hypothetical protein
MEYDASINPFNLSDVLETQVQLLRQYADRRAMVGYVSSVKLLR